MDPVARNGSFDLRIQLGSAVLANPTIAASGCYNRGEEYGQISDVSRYGAVTIKSITREPRLGNNMPRIALTPAGMLNAIGLQGPGVEYFLSHDAAKLARVPTAVIGSVAGFTVNEFVDVSVAMDGLANVVAIELDVSCPNVDREGQSFAADPDSIAAVVSAVKARVKAPVIAKLMPNVADLKPIARAAQNAGADAVSVINAVRGMVIDVTRGEPVLANQTGGLSGPAIRPIAVLAVWEVAQAVTIPIIGIGGIETGRDALEFLMAGATAVGIGTANFRNPLVHIRVIEAIEAEMQRRGFATVGELTGLANPNFAGRRQHHKAATKEAQH